MNDVERNLKSIRRAEPDVDFERRMDRLFLDSERAVPVWRRPVPLWLACALAGLMLFCGYGLRGDEAETSAHDDQPREAVRTVYFIEAPEDFRRALMRAEDEGGRLENWPTVVETGASDGAETKGSTI